MSIDSGLFFLGLLGYSVLLIFSLGGEQMVSEIPLGWSQHVVINTVILLRLTPVLKGTDLSVASDVFEIKHVNKALQQ